jgi:hypothetical protein
VSLWQTRLLLPNQGTCLTSVVNTNEEEIKLGLPTVKLEPYEIDAAQIRTVSTHGIEETEHRISELRSMIRTEHMNDVQRRSIMRYVRVTVIFFTCQETDCQSLLPQSMQYQHQVSISAEES